MADTGIISTEFLALEPGLIFDPETNRLDFTAVVEMPGINKVELYSRAKQWIVNTFKSANAVIQMDDKAEGVLIGKGRIKELKNPNASFITLAYNFVFTVKVYLKEGKYKYSFKDITYEYIGNSQYARSSYAPVELFLSQKVIKDIMVREMTLMTNDSNTAMIKPSTGNKDW